MPNLNLYNSSAMVMAVLILLVPAGCDNEQFSGTPDFGADYRVLQTSDYPALTGDSLYINIAYSGCDNRQDFALRGRRLGKAEAETWLYKITPDQLCDAYFEEVRAFYVPENIRTASYLYLITPGSQRIPIQ